MDVLQHFSQTRFIGYVPKIRKNLGEWFIIDVALSGKTDHNAAFIALKLKEYFDDRDGVIFICNSQNILVLVHMDKNVNGDFLSSGILEKLPEHSCVAQAAEVMTDGLVKIQLRIEAMLKENKPHQEISPLLKKRQNRQERVVMVVDDVMLMRSLINKAFHTRCKVYEFKDTEKVLESYLEYLPDIVFLDIHLPGGSGMDLLADIMRFDSTAYVIILSGDSIKDNIVKAKELGAHGFIAKPFTLDKLESCYQKCPSIK